jgi:hypothetical protein
MRAGQDFNEGRLPGPIFTDQAVTGAPFNIKADIIQRFDAGEVLREISDFKNILAQRGLPRSCLIGTTKVIIEYPRSHFLFNKEGSLGIGVVKTHWPRMIC